MIFILYKYIMSEVWNEGKVRERERLVGVWDVLTSGVGWVCRVCDTFFFNMCDTALLACHMFCWTVRANIAKPRKCRK
jgi:hypothetical protein